MHIYKHSWEAYDAFKSQMALAIAEAVHRLLQDKHLYQSVRVDASAVAKKLQFAGEGGRQHFEANDFPKHRGFNWLVKDGLGIMSLPDKDGPECILWEPPEIRTYCMACKRDDPFHPLQATNFLHRRHPWGATERTQVFVLSYVCQSCKATPYTYMIRRDHDKLTLSGRSPMQFVEVPVVIPKQVEKFFSDATVAYQAGQILPAIFMLRTLIEQWARPFCPEISFVDQVIEHYMSIHPSDFNGRFPSIKQVYSDLSAAVHAASADAALFESCCERVVKHFDARRLFNLAGPPGVSEFLCTRRVVEFVVT